MKPRGIFVQKLINFFEGMHLYDTKNNESTAEDNTEPTIIESGGLKPTNITSEEISKTKTIKETTSKAEEQAHSNTLPLLHSSVFLVPSVQMAFELIGYRPPLNTFFYLADMWQLLKIAYAVRHPLSLNYSLRRSVCSLDDLNCLERRRDLLDNIAGRQQECACSSERNLAKKATCPRNSLTWPAKPRPRPRIRRCSADEPATRPFTLESETDDIPAVFGPPTFIEFLENEATPQPEKTCDPLMIESIVKEMKDLDASIDKEIREVERLLSTPPLPPTEEDRVQHKAIKIKSNRLKRKLATKLSSTPNETDEAKILASELARKQLIQQRHAKKEIRRARRFYRNTMMLTPSIYSQYCAKKGDAKCSERIQWKSDRSRKQRSVSPDIDVWEALGARDSLLETSMYKPENDQIIEQHPLATKNETENEINENISKSFINHLWNIEPIAPCCCCSCHYRCSGISRTDVSTSTRVNMVDAETQTINSEFETRRHRTKSEEGLTQRSARQSEDTKAGFEKSTFLRHAIHLVREPDKERQPIQFVREPDTEKQPIQLDIEKPPSRHNVTKRFRDFFNDQTACVTGNKQQRANEKAETMQFRHFLLSRFLEHSAIHNEKLEDDIDQGKPPKDI